MELGLRVSWGTLIPSREKEALLLFEDAMTYYGKKMADGKVTYFEPFFFATGDHSVDNGFFIVKGAVPEIFKILEDPKYKELVTKASYLVDHFRTELLTVGEGVGEQIKRYENVLKTYA